MRTILSLFFIALAFTALESFAESGKTDAERGYNLDDPKVSTQPDQSSTSEAGINNPPFNSICANGICTPYAYGRSGIGSDSVIAPPDQPATNDGAKSKTIKGNR